MAAITAAVVVAGTAAYAANRQGAAAKKAGRAQASAAQQTIDEQSRLYNNSVEGAQPYAQAGTTALNQLNAVNAGDYSAFENSPDYLYARDIGIQGLDRGAAARGSLYSGGADADRIAFSSGLATQNLGNYTNRLQNMVNLGSNTQQYLGQLGQNYGNQFGNAMGIKGNANAQIAAAGPMTQAGYGNAIASGISTYMGAGGGGGGGGGFMGMFGSGGGGNTTGYEQGSLYNFGNNMGNFRTSSWGG
jgi:hypothetical protein